ncbi:MAG: ABC transporter permease [Anaerolineaceae bacterium]|nr:ABC transporter permease [Anaerolineaceae bacterium]
MNIFSALKEALGSLAANKLRSSLTILGIVIGVAAVIAMVSLGRGLQASITSQLSGIGTTQLSVFYMPDPEIRNPQPLTTGDMQALVDPINAPDVKAVSASISGVGLVSFGSKSSSATIYGTTANYAELNNLKFQEGGFFGEEQVLGQSSTVVLGPRLADLLFNRTKGLVGEMVRIEGQPYRVVGVLQSLGQGSVSFSDTDMAVLVPYTTARLRLIPQGGRDQVDTLTVQVRDSSRTMQATEQVKQILRTRHRTPVGLDDFYVFASKDILDAANSITSMLTIFLGGIAAISLLVGGIGIMNIMLVSVTERTREIGLRKAVGARRRDILVQFLAESVMLSLLGGGLGILLGWLIGVAVAVVSENSGNAITPIVGIDSILLATLSASAIGIFFGFYPANRAATLQPVEALRSE